jgi:hypothetical protein
MHRLSTLYKYGIWEDCFPFRWKKVHISRRLIVNGTILAGEAFMYNGRKEV